MLCEVSSGENQENFEGFSFLSSRTVPIEVSNRKAVGHLYGDDMQLDPEKPRVSSNASSEFHFMRQNKSNGKFLDFVLSD